MSGGCDRGDKSSNREGKTLRALQAIAKTLAFTVSDKRRAIIGV